MCSASSVLEIHLHQLIHGFTCYLYVHVQCIVHMTMFTYLCIYYDICGGISINRLRTSISISISISISMSIRL